jgi:hypothetical protein
MSLPGVYQAEEESSTADELRCECGRRELERRLSEIRTCGSVDGARARHLA